MIAVFENGLRELPPKDFEAVLKIVAKVMEISESDKFVIDETDKVDSEIVSLYSSEKDYVAITRTHIHVSNKRYPLPAQNCKIGFTPKQFKPIAVWLEPDGTVKMYDIIGTQEVYFSAKAERIIVCEGRIYLQSHMNVVEITLNELPTKILASVFTVGQVLDLPGATTVGESVIIQNLFGLYHASIFPRPKAHHQIALPELEGYQVLDAKYFFNVLVIIAQKNGKYDRFVIRLQPDFKGYELRRVEDVGYTGINFTVNHRGICVLITEDERVELFTIQPGTDVKVIDDKVISGDMRLCTKGGKAHFYRGRKLYRLSMKK